MQGKKIFAVVLAGGKGTRMGNIEKPKQFMEIGGKPILIHTVEKFAVHPEFTAVLVLSPKQWIPHTQNLIKKYIPSGIPIAVIEGGADRNGTIMNSIAYIEETYGLDEDTVIVTHDSVRPFVSHRIIQENIDAGMKYEACDTTVPAVDTITESLDGESISSIPDRSHMFLGQTPQTFRAKKLKELYLSLSEEEKAILTDACKIMVLKGVKVHMIEGEVSNTKITYPYDIKIAEALLGGEMS
jgi:2-C-methyl-D-erythritol 4-phosphate cytidylyltransferase